MHSPCEEMIDSECAQLDHMCLFEDMLHKQGSNISALQDTDDRDPLPLVSRAYLLLYTVCIIVMWDKEEAVKEGVWRLTPDLLVN